MTWFRVFTITLSVLFLGLILSVTVGGLLLSWYMGSIGRETVTVSDTLVEIPYGSSLRRVSQLMHEAGVIDDAKQFYWYVRLGRTDGQRIQAGFYKFSGPVSKQAVAERLLSGKDQSWKVTFKEGQTLVDLALTLETMGLVSKEDFITAMSSDEILALIKAPQAHNRKVLQNDMGGIEGYLFPDTYFFSKRDTAKTIIEKMYARLIALLDEEIATRMSEQNVSLHEVLTLASIIEKETGASFERPIIASVYKNRLKRGMRLQADPTVIYGIKDYQGKIGKKDLTTYHPYNTYTNKGLPPGPIAAPGLLAIRAALWPQSTNYLYFVSKNDGSHVFCENLACHQKAVKIWQIDYFKKAARR